MQLLKRKGTVIQATSWMGPEDVRCHKTTNIAGLHLPEVPRAVRFIETESRLGLPRAGETRRGELAFSEYQVSVWENEKFLEMGARVNGKVNVLNTAELYA